VNWITAIVSLVTALVFLPMVPTVMSELDDGLAKLRKLDEEAGAAARDTDMEAML
jgi:hypothetical protein